MAKKPENLFDPAHNPFLDPNNNPFLKKDFTEMFQGFENPDFQDLGETCRKNMEALGTANQIAAEGLQTIYRRQNEILKSTLDEANATLQEIQGKGVSAPDVADQIGQIKSCIESAISNTKEISDLMARSQAEAFDIVNSRFVESLEELKSKIAKTREE